MEENTQHFQHIILYYFRKGKNTTETQKNCVVNGQGAMTDRKWLARFRAADFSLDNAPRSGRPVEVDSNKIQTLIENNQCYTMQEIANISKYPNQ